VAGSISVTPEQLQQISARLTSGAGEVESILTQLAGYMAPLQGHWVGQAQAQFEALHEALAGIARLTQQAGMAYETNEHNIASTFRV
jgi:WXG100 family type VII secretion target